METAINGKSKPRFVMPPGVRLRAFASFSLIAGAARTSGSLRLRGANGSRQAGNHFAPAILDDVQWQKLKTES